MEWIGMAKPHLVWFIIGLVCIIAEFILPGVIIVFFGVGAWLVALLVFLFDINISLQITIFSIVSVGALLLLRRRLYPGPVDPRTDTEEEFVGKTAVVTRRITRSRPGQVRFKGALWQAQTRSPTALEEGSIVCIVGHDSIVLYVGMLEESFDQ